jgi:SET domain-containing protein
LSVKPSTLFSPDCDVGWGVFAKQPIQKNDIVSEYGGVIRPREDVEELRKLKLHTHIKPIIPWSTYLDSRWSNGDPLFVEESPGPPIRMYLEGHYLAGLMNSAYYKVID